MGRKIIFSPQAIADLAAAVASQSQDWPFMTIAATHLTSTLKL
jgi:hypothetical protein